MLQFAADGIFRPDFHAHLHRGFKGAVDGCLEDDQIAPPPPMGSKIDTDYIQGMARIDDRLMILLDVDKILSTDELAAID
mgnify:CR=1 FL=1